MAEIGNLLMKVESSIVLTSFGWILQQFNQSTIKHKLCIGRGGLRRWICKYDLKQFINNC